MTSKERAAYIKERRNKERDNNIPNNERTFGASTKARQRALTKVGFGPKEVTK